MIDTESGVQPSTHSHYIKGDTLIYNETWKKVFFSKEGQEDSYFAAMREEGQKVYAIASGCDTPRLLYDFSLQVGDTPICISESKLCGAFDCLIESTESLNYDDWYTRMELKHIDVINVNGQERRRFIFESDYSACSRKLSDFSYPALVWVEGIGSCGGPFLSWSKPTPESRLTCYLDGNVIFEDEDFYVPGATDDINQHTSVYAFGKDEKYDLQGRRIDATPAKGVYIRNGRKQVVR
ncbi:MAG: hypothetical protein IJ892_11780 [Prevotella sp.]|nr:hypothetical protein [Prevotella sp.]